MHGYPGIILSSEVDTIVSMVEVSVGQYNNFKITWKATRAFKFFFETITYDG